MTDRELRNESVDEPFLVFGAPRIEDEEIEEVVECLRSGWIGTGPRVATFEQAFRTYTGGDHAVALSSCTAALHLSMLASDLGPGDEVITTPLTFCSTINAIIHAGATPVLADVDPRTMCMDPEAVSSAVTDRTRAIVPVHYAGRCCDMDAIGAIARAHDLLVIEDCAHAIESTWRGRQAGTIGDFGCFSFYATKNVCTGEGGMVLTRREEDASRIKTLALHGMTKDAWRRFSDSGYRHYQVVEAGFKANMMDLQAALGLHQLARIEENWFRRAAIWGRYQESLSSLPLGRPPEPEAGNRHAHHLYTLLVEESKAGMPRDAFLEELTKRGIGAGVHYLSIAEHPYYRERFGWTPDATPNARDIGRQTLSIPLSGVLHGRDVERVIGAIRGIVEAGARRRAATARAA